MIRVRAVWEGLAGGEYLSTYIFNGGAGAAQDAANAVHTCLSGLVGNFANDLAVRVQPDVDVVEPLTGQVTSRVGVAAPAAVFGSALGDLLPLSTQGLITLRTGVFVAGREVRGRHFYPGATEDLSTDGKPVAAYLAALANNYGDLRDNSAAFGAPLAVWSRARGQVHNVAFGQAWSDWAVLRSRRDA